MGDFIKKSIEVGEEIKYNGRLHWSSIWRYILCSWIMVIGGLGAAGTCYYYKQQNVYIYIGLAVAALGLIIGLIVLSNDVSHEHLLTILVSWRVI